MNVRNKVAVSWDKIKVERERLNWRRIEEQTNKLTIGETALVSSGI